MSDNKKEQLNKIIDLLEEIHDGIPVSADNIEEPDVNSSLYEAMINILHIKNSVDALLEKMTELNDALSAIYDKLD